MKKLTIAISTMGKNVASIKFGEEHPHICYVVLIQKETKGCLDSLPKREDIQAITLTTTGLSHSRNAALATCQTPYLYMTDDDLIMDIDTIIQVVTTMETKNILVAHTRITHMEGSIRWNGPTETNLSIHDLGMAASCELFFHHPTLIALDAGYNPAFGVGSANYPMGEENLFLHQLVANTINIVHIPLTVAHHPGPSSGDKPLSANGVIAQLRVQNTLRPRKNAWKRTLAMIVKNKHLPIREKLRIFMANTSQVEHTLLSVVFEPKTLIIHDKR